MFQAVLSSKCAHATQASGSYFKRKLLAAIFMVFVLVGAAQADFCVTTTDVACDGNATYNSGATGGEDFTTWYVYYDATGPCNQVTIIVYLDLTTQIWTQTLCGCGWTSFDYPTANVHGVKVKVACERCVGGTCGGCSAGTATVKVYTPSTNACVNTVTCP